MENKKLKYCEIDNIIDEIMLYVAKNMIVEESNYLSYEQKKFIQNFKIYLREKIYIDLIEILID